MAKGKKQQCDTFSKAYIHIIRYNWLCGFNLQSTWKSKFVHIIFGIALMIKVENLITCYFNFKSNSNDYVPTFARLMEIAVALGLLFMHIWYRFSLKYLTVAIGQLDRLLIKFNRTGFQPFLPHTSQTLVSFIILSFAIFCIYILALVPRDRNNSDREGSMLNLQGYKMAVIRQYIFEPTNQVLSMCGIITMTIMIRTLSLIFKQLAMYRNDVLDTSEHQLGLTDIVKWISLHRDACQIMKLVDRAFKMHFLILNTFLPALTILTLRGLQLAPWILLIPISLLVFGLLMSLLKCTSTVNTMVKMSLDHLMLMGQQILCNGNLSFEEAIALEEKIDLYVTYVSLDSPGLTLGGFLVFNSHLIVVILGFILNYCVFLYKK